MGYTERSEALSPEKENDLQRSENVQNDPDVPKNYKGYLGYTDRKAATKMEKDLDDQEKEITQLLLKGLMNFQRNNIKN